MQRRTALTFAAVVAPIAILVAGCGGANGGPSTGTTSTEGPSLTKKIFSLSAAAARQAGGDVDVSGVTVTDLKTSTGYSLETTKAGAEPIVLSEKMDGSNGGQKIILNFTDNTGKNVIPADTRYLAIVTPFSSDPATQYGTFVTGDVGNFKQLYDQFDFGNSEKLYAGAPLNTIVAYFNDAGAMIQQTSLSYDNYGAVVADGGRTITRNNALSTPNKYALLNSNTEKQPYGIYDQSRYLAFGGKVANALNQGFSLATSASLKNTGVPAAPQGPR